MNSSIFGYVFGLSHRSFFFDAVGVFLAKYLLYIAVIGFFIFLFRAGSPRKRIRVFVEVALAAILSRGIITEFIHFFYPVVRPFAALSAEPLFAPWTAASFPSGHAAFFFALAASLFFFSRQWGITFGVFAFVNGLARIYAGVHWPLDIAAGAAVGILSALLTHFLLDQYREKESEIET